MSNSNHVVIRNQNLFCSHCGSEFKLKFPISVKDFQSKSKAFNELHKDCEKTWTEPTPDNSLSIKDKAMFWMSNGERGLSSETMWNFFMGNKDFKINHPHDPDDFSRCYKLLLHVPEWKNRITEIGALSTQWKNLSENWEKLTEMFEENKRTNWENSEKIGMYEFMQKLIE